MVAPSDVEKIYDELTQLREELQSLRHQVETLGSASRPSIRTDHPHVIRVEGVHGGRPTIRGTGVSVQAVIEQVQLGRLPQQIVADFDGVLTLAQVYDVLSYYHEHQSEIDQYITDSREALWSPPRTANSS